MYIDINFSTEALSELQMLLRSYLICLADSI